MGVIATESEARSTGVSNNPNYVENQCVTKSRASLFGCSTGSGYSSNQLVQSSDLSFRDESYYIEPDACTGCGECVKYCQEGVILLNTDGAYYIQGGWYMSSCVGCGICVSYCPVSAIRGPIKRDKGPNYPPNPPIINPPVIDPPLVSNPAQLIYPSDGGSSFTFSRVAIKVNTPSGAQRFTPNQDIRVIIGPPDDCTGYYEICRLSSGTAYNVTYDNYGQGYLIDESPVTFRLPFLPYNGNYEIYASTVFPNGQEGQEIIGTTESGANVSTDNGNLWRCDYVYYNGRCNTIVSSCQYTSDADGNSSIDIWL